MVRLFGLAVGVVLFGAAVHPRAAGADNPPAAAIKLGMLESMFRDIQPGMVKAVSTPFRSLFERQTGLAGDVEIVSDAETQANKLKEKKLQFGVFHGFEFAQIRTRHPELRTVVVSVPYSRVCQAYVIVHKDSKVEKLADLGNEPLIIPRGIKAHCLAFIDKSRKGLPAETAKPTPKPTLTTEDVLNSVVEGTTAAALVDVGAYNGYQGLQPGASQHLKVLCKSEVFPFSVVAYRKGAVDDELVARIRKGLIGVNTTSQGKPLMMLWNLKGFEEVPADYDAQLENILKAYPAAGPTRPEK